MAIQLFVPKFELEEVLAGIRECLEKGWTGLGFKTIEMEQAWRDYTGLPHAHFLSSNTVGLHLALNVFKQTHGWKDGDEIISTPITFVSTNHAILYERLTPVFADVDNSLCLSPESIEAAITPRTRAVMYVGLGGNTGRLDEVADLCRRKKLILVLDAAHMSGTRSHGKHVGTEADVTIFSFQAVKNLPTADSGMICFADAELDALARRLTWLGIDKDTHMRTLPTGSYSWKYDVTHVGFKYHGNSIMAAMGLVQLKYLERDNAYRRNLCHTYDSLVAPLESRVGRIQMPASCESSRHLYQVLVEDRDEVMQSFYRRQIYPGVHYIDNTQYAMYRDLRKNCPKAQWVSERLLSLPLHLSLTANDCEQVVGVLKSCRPFTWQ